MAFARAFVGTGQPCISWVKARPAATPSVSVATGWRFAKSSEIIKHVGNVGLGDIIGEIVEVVRRGVAVEAQLRKFIEARAEIARRCGQFYDPVGAGALAAVGQS